jgi:protein required for attachment to host cells
LTSINFAAWETPMMLQGLSAKDVTAVPAQRPSSNFTVARAADDIAPQKRKKSQMKIPPNALILVADGRKAIILRNAGDEKFPNLKSELSVADENPSTAAQGSDRPGRVNYQDRRSSVGQTDWHAEEEAAFAKRVALMLDGIVREKQTRHVIIVAPPRTLSVLRRNLNEDSASKVIAELAQDLVNHTVGDIETHLDRAKAVS